MRISFDYSKLSQVRSDIAKRPNVTLLAKYSYFSLDLRRSEVLAPIASEIVPEALA